MAQTIVLAPRQVCGADRWLHGRGGLFNSGSGSVHLYLQRGALLRLLSATVATVALVMRVLSRQLRVLSRMSLSCCACGAGPVSVTIVSFYAVVLRNNSMAGICTFLCWNIVSFLFLSSLTPVPAPVLAPQLWPPSRLHLASGFGSSLCIYTFRTQHQRAMRKNTL